MSLSPWWEAWPGRLEFELDELTAAGIVWAEDAEAKAEGVVRLLVTVPARITRQDLVTLNVTFPDFYPYFRPEVIAPDLEMGHHQNPFGHNLCLIGRSSRWWQPEDTLRWLLENQLATALTSGQVSDIDFSDLEEDQGEPFSAYYRYADNSIMLVDSAWQVPPMIGNGPAKFAIAGSHQAWTNGGQLTLALLTASEQNGTSFLTLPELLRSRIGGTELDGRWCRVDTPIKSNDPEHLWNAAEIADTARTGAFALDTGVCIELRAVAFPEERSRQVTGDGWILLIRETRLPRGEMRKQKGRQKRGNGTRPSATPKYHVVRPAWAGVLDMASRVPDLKPLSVRSVAVFGCGAIGSTVIDHLVRAGVGRFTLVDADILEAGNLVRHAATFREVGLHKANAAAQIVIDRNPHAEVQARSIRVGGVRDSSGENQVDQLSEICASVDLVIDATAEVAVQEALAHVAKSSGRPYVMLEATNGAWGGSVLIIDPEADWCFSCFQRDRMDGRIPVPSASHDNPNQPVGCAEPTFTGAGFDLAEVSLQATRMIVGQLLKGAPTKYSPDGMDVAVLTLRDESRGRVLPEWRGFQGVRHPSCAAH